MSINSGAVRNGTIKKNLQRLYVSTAILTVLSIPALAQQVIADGTDEIVAPGTVIDTGMAGGAQASGLSAKNGGSIEADGPLSITTGGFGANGATAADGGTIAITGATIKTSGAMALGIMVSHDSDVIATNIDISTSGQYSHGVGVYYTGTYTQNGGSVTTTGNNSAGYQIQRGGTADITGVDVTTAGTGADGVQLLNDGSSLKMQDSSISISGANAIGVSAANAVLADLIDTTIVTSGNGSHGILAQDGATVNASNVDVTTTGVGSHGVLASGGQVNVDRSTISTTGNESYGVLSSGAGSNVSIANSSISTEGYGSLATRAENGGQLDISGSTISTAAKYGHGLQAIQGSSATIENSMIETRGDTAYGLAASAASEIYANDVIITTEGPRSHAVWAGGGGHVVVDSAIINTSGYDSSGLFTAGGTIDANNVDVTTSGSQAAGALAYVGTINLSNSRVTTHASSGLAALLSGTVNATNVEVIVDGAGNTGVQASYGGTINLDGVNITGTNGNKGITIGDGGTVIGTNVAVDVQSSGNIAAIGLNMFGDNGNPLIDLTNSSIIVGGEGSTGLSAATGGQGTVRLKNSILQAKDGTAIQIYSSNFDIELDGSSVVGKQLFNVTDYAGTDPRTINITATNGSYLEGDVLVGAGDAQHAAISLDQGSVLKGATDGLDELNVANGSIWQITGDSNVDALLNDNGMIAFGPDGAFKTLTVGSLEGANGSYLFNSKLNEGGAATETDQLVVTGDATGDGTFFIANKGGQGAVTGTGATDGIKLTDIAGASDASFELGAAAVVGIYDYQLVKADGQDWYLQTDGSDPSGHIVDTVPGYNVALAGAREHILTSLDTFHERVGELRLNPEDEGFHAWMRGLGKTGSYAPDVTGHASQGFNLSTAGVQIGSDYSAIGVINADDKFTLGVFGELAQSSFDVKGRSASGSIASKGLGAYASWQEHAPTATTPGTGFYVDAVVKHDWLDFGVSARSVSGFDIGHSYSGSATSASIEAGYGFYLGDNLVLQPQAQLIYSSVNADSFMDGNGIVVHGQQTESLLGRVGLRLEKTYYFGDATKPETIRSVTTFVDANVKHEFMGKSSLVASDTLISSDMGGTSFEVGVGATAQISDNVSLFGRASVEFGGATELAGKVTGGLKITW